MSKQTPLSLIEHLNQVDYSQLNSYVPSRFSIELINLMKLITDGDIDSATPVVHYQLLDNFFKNSRNVIEVCHRGFSKTTLMRYLIWYIAIYCKLPVIGKLTFAMYVTDTIDNGVKTMKRNLLFEWENSKFLQKFIPKANITEQIWEFTNADGNMFTCQGYGAMTGIRGTTVRGKRPKLVLFDDLMSDKVADSPTCVESIENTIYKAARQALDPMHRKMIWAGTPFNAKDPLHKAIESGSWEVSVFPICEEFPCKKSEFKGSWPKRFTWNFVNKEYEELKALGKLAAFNQELMLRIMSDEDRLIEDSDISWYKRELVLLNRGNFNYYITTDFATSKEEANDFSVISVWAYNNKGHWFLVDGMCKKQLMDKNINDLFMYAQRWNPQQVGIEVSGQQGGFIPWIQEQMITRNCWFNLASETNNGKPGVKPIKNKLVRFQIVVPWFKSHIIHFPVELKETPLLSEMISELELIASSGFRSKHDDCQPFNTKVCTPNGLVNIGDLTNDDVIYAYSNSGCKQARIHDFRCTGAKEIYEITTESGEKLKGTFSHLVLTTEGYKPICELQNKKIVRSLLKWKLMGSNGQKNQMDTTNQQSESQMVVGKTFYTSMCMNRLMVKFQKIMKYTTSTMIKITIDWVISNFYIPLATELNTKNNSLRTEENLQNFVQRIKKKYKDWRNLQKQECILEKVNVQNFAQEIVSVYNVGKVLLCITIADLIQNFVLVPVEIIGMSIIQLQLNVVKIAVKSLNKLLGCKSFVLKDVLQFPEEIKLIKESLNNVQNVENRLKAYKQTLCVEKNARDLEKINWKKRDYCVKIDKVKCIKKIGLCLTYTFEVAKYHNYLVDNGMIMHNCIDTVSQLSALKPWKPSEVTNMQKDESGIWESDEMPEENTGLTSYIV